MNNALSNNFIWQSIMLQTMFEKWFHLWDHCLMIWLSRGFISRKRAANQKPPKVQAWNKWDHWRGKYKHIINISLIVLRSFILWLLTQIMMQGTIKISSKVFQNKNYFGGFKSPYQGLIGFWKRYEQVTQKLCSYWGRNLVVPLFSASLLLFPPFPMNARVFSPTGL